ncbi:MAG: hypothetical protein JSS16_00205 [Proteobacteria bacterium]|uniref:hypothetical protein n=1 Tax=Rudaea sp. TaxID=2136325 RepID=UPI001DF22BE6|nr:hypothetical protein [Pseudomonadota bacterium]MBS0568307.1 hypothetical protein [Pseudomonadota bacterium]
MKTERVTLLTTPKFKAFLGSEARREGISVAELVRNRFEPQPSAETVMVETLTAELATRLKEARSALNEGLAEFHAWLAEKNGAQAKQPKRAATRRGRA